MREACARESNIYGYGIWMRDTIWHLFVLTGSICHYLAILLYYQAPVA